MNWGPIEKLSKAELAIKIMEVAHLTGQFKLRSGQISHEYFDKYQFESRPVLLYSIAHHMVPLLPKKTELLGALEMGGIPVATVLSMLTGLPIVFIRKEAKDYGTCRFAEGPQIQGKQMTLIEDVITTGGQVVESTAALRADGALIENVLCVIDRSQGRTQKLQEAKLSHQALFTMDEIKALSKNDRAW